MRARSDGVAASIMAMRWNLAEMTYMQCGKVSSAVTPRSARAAMSIFSSQERIPATAFFAVSKSRVRSMSEAPELCPIRSTDIQNSSATTSPIAGGGGGVGIEVGDGTGGAVGSGGEQASKARAKEITHPCTRSVINDHPDREGDIPATPVHQPVSLAGLETDELVDFRTIPEFLPVDVAAVE